MLDYDYLKIVVGGGVSSGNSSIASDLEDTDAATFEQESESFGMEGFSYDPNSDTFIAPDHYEPPYQPPSPHQPTPPPHFSLDSEVPIEKRNRHKRNRFEYERIYGVVGIKNQGPAMENLSSSVGIIVVHFEKMSNMMEKREQDRELKNNIWDIIKDIPNLDDKSCFKIVELMKSKANKDLFLKMSLEDRLSWIKFKLGND
ncbi:uncharacterized protein At2g29880 [Medicago truncatula]|uniref:At2g29880-like C-terminal domain-containing protein n=1 Tax=Medicago truncatula TaxID=3880 RepID=A0A072V1E7_MEDTR|nr:uncharacterized protein At2g29880 [Medicago truncatula]KEH35667.1 hypothetical protein MTR_3g097540 [Medicago truncatula]